MKLLAIKLTDFQCHEETVIRFGADTTTIRGETDAGKSSVLRALQWVCLNNFPGDDFVREGTKRAKVALKIEVGGKEHLVVREKGGQENIYKLDGKVYRSFLTSVPKDIFDLLQLQEINFQGQHDSPFWFTETAGEVSRRLNAVIDLSIIDTALSNVASEVRTALERKGFCEERVLTTQSELEKLVPQKERITDFERIEKHEETYEQSKKSSSCLGEELSQIQSHHQNYVRYLEGKQAGEAVVEHGKQYYLLATQNSTLTGMLYHIDAALRLIVSIPDFSVVEILHKSFREAQSAFETLDELLSSVAESERRFNEKQQALKESDEKYHEQIKGQDCPLCGQKLPYP